MNAPVKITLRSSTFCEMLASLRLDDVFTAKDIADRLGISQQYFRDLELGRRKPSVNVINAICTYMGRGPLGRKQWHLAGARAHGWEV